MKSLAKLLETIAARDGSATAVLSEGGELSYGEVAREVARLGRELQTAGLGRGHSVAIITTIEPASIILLAAVSWTGASIIPIAAGSGHLQNGLHQFAPCYLLGAKDLVEPVADKCCATVRTRERDFALAHWERQRPTAESARADEEVVFLTSGSTGEPLGVVCPEQQVAFARTAIQERLRYNARDRILVGGAFSFDYHYYQLLLAFAAGATLVLCEQVFNPLAAAEAIYRHRVTVLPLIPYSFRLLLRSRLLDRADFSGIRVLTATGEVWPRSEIEALSRVFPGAAIFPMYGLTECKRVSILNLQKCPELAGSVGFPLNGTRVHIVAEDESEALPGEVGEIAVRGPHLAAGYHREPEVTARRFRRLADGNSLLLTGDRGYLDEQGALWFAGRDAQMIKHHGLRTAALAIESALLACPHIRRAVVTNVFTDTGEKVAVMVEISDDHSAQSTRIEEVVRRSWPLTGQPDHIEFGPIPLLPSGKPARPKVASLLHERCSRLS